MLDLLDLVGGLVGDLGKAREPDGEAAGVGGRRARRRVAAGEVVAVVVLPQPVVAMVLATTPAAPSGRLPRAAPAPAGSPSHAGP